MATYFDRIKTSVEGALGKRESVSHEFQDSIRNYVPETGDPCILDELTGIVTSAIDRIAKSDMSNSYKEQFVRVKAREFTESLQVRYPQR